MTLPGAADLFFRQTSAPSSEPAEPAPPAAPPEPLREPPPEPRPEAQPEPPSRATTTGTAVPEPAAPASARVRRPRVTKPSSPQPSGRQRHDEKITVYISATELLALEQTRLTLRADHGLSADRGRIVREAVAVLLADFEEHGDGSMLVQRLDGP
ncbi:hypothetical protein [Murinocardiopsis flavida]|uniref:hypothetical protein n=1 Tax=Murinocardiopsis flavida TaxID=645275 RepID=UPI0037445E74